MFSVVLRAWAISKCPYTMVEPADQVLMIEGASPGGTENQALSSARGRRVQLLDQPLVANVSTTVPIQQKVLDTRPIPKICDA
jgi:hypothetical protein